jgi:hypothetical protein
MFDGIEKIEEPEVRQKPNRNSWKYMNWIQKTGVISSIVLYFICLLLSDGHAKPATIVGVVGWSCLLFAMSPALFGKCVTLFTSGTQWHSLALFIPVCCHPIGA